MHLVLSYIYSFACYIASCNPKHSYPTDPAGTFRHSLELQRYRSSWMQPEFNTEFEKYPVVSTQSGLLQGYTMKTISGKRIYAFEGIPYGETTGGKNRFQPPVPKRNWAGIRKAHSPGSLCLQSYRGKIPLRQGRENCLFLNIFTIRESIYSAVKLPVIFWIHGGGFHSGVGSDYGPAYMLERDVVVVTINYRLNIFGFLSTGDDVVPGNNGLKDQALALKWVHDNIHNFGGDTNEITIMGHSAGAACVHFHMISPYYETLEKNGHLYFARAISMSGSSFSGWALRSKAKNANLNRRLAKETGCPLPNGQNSQQFMDCLRNIDPYILNKIQYRLFPTRIVSSILFGPVIETSFWNSTFVRANGLNGDINNIGRPFLTRHPDDLYAEGAVARIPWMVSRSSGEGFIFSFIINNYGLLSRQAINYLWKNHASDILDYRTEPDSDKITQRIQNYYFGRRKVSQVHSTVFDHIFTARAHTAAAHKAIQSHSLIAPTHAMLISGPIKYDVTFSSVIGTRGRQPNGVIHADEVSLMFNVSDFVRGLKSTEKEFKLSRVLTEFVVNFANNGSTSYSGEARPEINEHWDAVENPCKVRYLNVTLNDGNKMVELPRKILQTYDFWLTLGLSDLQKSPSVPLPTCSSYSRYANYLTI